MDMLLFVHLQIKLFFYTQMPLVVLLLFGGQLCHFHIEVETHWFNMCINSFRPQVFDG